MSDVNATVSIDDLVSKIGNPAGVSPGSESSTEYSGPPPVPPGVPPVPGGRFTPLTPGPGTLEWGCSPSALLTWFQSWTDFWRVNWLGTSPSEVQLLSLVKVNLSEEWKNATAEFDWDRGTMKGLHILMDQKLEITGPL